jgi:hypothetical protein
LADKSKISNAAKMMVSHYWKFENIKNLQPTDFKLTQHLLTLFYRDDRNYRLSFYNYDYEINLYSIESHAEEISITKKTFYTALQRLHETGIITVKYSKNWNDSRNLINRIEMTCLKNYVEGEQKNVKENK